MRRHKTWDISATGQARRAVLATRFSPLELSRYGYISRYTVERLLLDRDAVLREDTALRVLDAIRRTEAKLGGLRD